MTAPDPTSAPAMPEWSAYAGEPFNLTERRPLTIVAETGESFVVAGFYHQAQFWQAVLPKRGVLEIVGQRLNFSKPRRGSDGRNRPSVFFLNHVQARLIMEPEQPVQLYPEGARPEGAPAHTVNDFCYSVEAVGPFGRRWNVSDALLGNLALVHRFLSTEEVAFERIVRERMTVLQSPPLPLEADVRSQMLCEAVRASHRAGLTRPYFMMRPPGSATNCTSEPLKLLDRVLRAPLWQRFFHRFPVYPRGYLKLRGLWQDGQAAPTLNEQMASWLSSDDAKARRQMHLAKKKHTQARVEVPQVPLGRKLTSFVKALRQDRR